jgi:hypothetical protein
MALNPSQRIFLDWLCTPPREREPRNQELLAAQLGIDKSKLTQWRNHDKEFLEAWERRYLATIGNPGTKQEIMKTLYRTATDPDDPKHVQAAKAYFEIEGSMKPARMEVSVSRPASELSDEQLEALLAGHASREKEVRTGTDGDVVPFPGNDTPSER